jgi:hypothetical protein
MAAQKRFGEYVFFLGRWPKVNATIDLWLATESAFLRMRSPDLSHLTHHAISLHPHYCRQIRPAW